MQASIDRGTILSMNEQPDTGDLNDRIRFLVEDYWTREKVPLLLSRLGLQDKGEVSVRARQYAKSLREYLSHQLISQVQVIQHSKKSSLVGAIPACVNLDEQSELDLLLEKTQIESQLTIPRFHRAFWSAFRTPLDESKRRYVNVHRPIRFYDLMTPESSHGHEEIDREYIVGPDAEGTKILHTIQKWLRSKHLEMTPFLSSQSTTEQPTKSLLDRLLNSLDPSELARVTMPLDVVQKLRNETA